MTKQIREAEEAVEKLRRYNEIVAKLSSAAFNPVIPKRERLTRDESIELNDLKLYFNTKRVNEAGLELCEVLLNELKEAMRPKGLLDIFGRRPW